MNTIIKISILLTFFSSPFILNYIKLERLLATPCIHERDDYTYNSSIKFGFSYFLESDYVKIKSMNKTRIVTLYRFDTLPLKRDEEEIKMVDLNLFSKIKYVILTTISNQSYLTYILTQ